MGALRLRAARALLPCGPTLLGAECALGPLHCRPPEAMGEIVGLKNKKCVACEGGIEALSESEINRLQKQVGSWAPLERNGAASWLPTGRFARGRGEPAAEAGGASAAALVACTTEQLVAVHGRVPYVYKTVGCSLAFYAAVPPPFDLYPTPPRPRPPQCAGWRLGKNAAGHDCISHEWKVRNFRAGLDLFQRCAGGSGGREFDGHAWLCSTHLAQRAAGHISLGCRRPAVTRLPAPLPSTQLGCPC